LYVIKQYSFYEVFGPFLRACIAIGDKNEMSFYEYDQGNFILRGSQKRSGLFERMEI
jgi:hypothetical protein